MPIFGVVLIWLALCDVVTGVRPIDLASGSCTDGDRIIAMYFTHWIIVGWGVGLVGFRTLDLPQVLVAMAAAVVATSYRRASRSDSRPAGGSARIPGRALRSWGRDAGRVSIPSAVTGDGAAGPRVRSAGPARRFGRIAAETQVSKGRLEAFSDGVLAIIITIMVLALVPPKGTTIDDLRPLAPVFPAHPELRQPTIWWNNHHHLFQAVRVVDGRVLWANMLLLFFLSLYPFATA